MYGLDGIDSIVVYLTYGRLFQLSLASLMVSESGPQARQPRQIMLNVAASSVWRIAHWVYLQNGQGFNLSCLVLAI